MCSTLCMRHLGMAWRGQQGVGAESPLVDGTAQWFCTIVKTCVLPCKSAALAADTLEVLVCAPKDD